MTVGEKEQAEADPTVVPTNGEAGATPQEPQESEGDVVELKPAIDPELVALREELATLKRDGEQASARLRAVSKAYTELQAEMKSFRERMEQRAKQDTELQSYEMVRQFFDPVMNLKRSVQNPGDDVQKLVQGLQMVLEQFMDTMKKLGLAEVPGVGAPFDPNMHEALGVTPVADKELDAKVLVVHTTGYMVKGRVLQAAQVVIGKYEEVGGEA